MKLLQQSGLEILIQLGVPSLTRGSHRSTLTDGTPILPNSTPYTVTCNEFIATGGDNFSVFLSGTNVTRIGVSDLDAMIDYVQFNYGIPPSNTPIDPAVYPDGRIINNTPAP